MRQQGSPGIDVCSEVSGDLLARGQRLAVTVGLERAVGHALDVELVIAEPEELTVAADARTESGTRALRSSVTDSAANMDIN